LFFVCAFILERLKLTNDSRYFYPIAVALAFVAMSGLASDYEPFRERLDDALPWTRGEIEYLFILNAGIYLVLQTTLGRFAMSQVQAVAKAFRFVIPGHILTSLLSLGIRASNRWNSAITNLSLKHEARALEILLPVVALVWTRLAGPSSFFSWVSSSC
jgi:hypothetical protein